MGEYTINEADFVRANELARRKLRLTISGIALAVPLALLAVKGFDRPTIHAVVILYILLIPFFLWLAPAINRRSYRRIYRKNPLLHKRQRFQIDENGIRLSSENGESRYRFDEIKKIRIERELVMIYPLTTLFHMIPRSALSQHELGLLKAHAG